MHAYLVEPMEFVANGGAIVAVVLLSLVVAAATAALGATPRRVGSAV